MVHIGNRIEEIMKEKKVRPTDLGRKIGRTSQSIYDIIKRENITTDLLAAIGEALDYDFFKLYARPVAEVNDTAGEYHRMNAEKPTISITINNIDEKKIGRIFRKLNEIIQ